MSKRLTVDDFRESLNCHVAAKGAEVRAKHGPRIGWSGLLGILQDPTAVRYPCEVLFDAEPLLPGECAHALPNGDDPRAGFRIIVHPHYQDQLEAVPLLVLYQLVVVNYGPFASADDAESFGAAVLGLSKDEYYEALCVLAGKVAGLGSHPEAGLQSATKVTETR